MLNCWFFTSSIFLKYTNTYIIGSLFLIKYIEFFLNYIKLLYTNFPGKENPRIKRSRRIHQHVVRREDESEHKTRNCAMQEVSHLGGRGFDRCCTTSLSFHPSIFASCIIATTNRWKKKEKRNLASAEIEKITVLFFEQHRRGRTSSQAYSKSWCKLSKRRAHTHTRIRTQIRENNNRKRWSLCVCTIHIRVTSTFDLVRKVISMAGYWILRYLHALYRFFPHFPLPSLFFYPSCVTFTRRTKPIKSYDFDSVVP